MYYSGLNVSLLDKRRHTTVKQVCTCNRKVGVKLFRSCCNRVYDCFVRVGAVVWISFKPASSEVRRGHVEVQVIHVLCMDLSAHIIGMDSCFIGSATIALAVFCGMALV